MQVRVDNKGEDAHEATMKAEIPKELPFRQTEVCFVPDSKASGALQPL